jgi:hypothetical protein
MFFREENMKVSRKFTEAVKMADRPAYKIAWEAGIHPVLLSKILHGYERLRPNDCRVMKIARILGLNPEDCLEDDSKGRDLSSSEANYAD